MNNTLSMLNMLLRSFLFVVIFVLGSSAIAAESKYWFDGKWFPMSTSYSGDGILHIRDGKLKWGYRPTDYSLGSITPADVDVPATEGQRIVVLKATLVRRAKDGRAWGLGEKEKYLVFKPYEESHLSMYICPSLADVRKKLINDGNNYCSTGGFSRSRKDLWRNG